MKKLIEGRIWVLGDNINTDLIVPSRVLTERDKNKLLAATLEVVLPDFARKVKEGDIIVAGKNFGSGSSREEAVFVLKELGIKAIIAESFARIYYRNCINQGIPPIVPIFNHDGDLKKENLDKDENYEDNKASAINPIGMQGDTLRIDFTRGQIINLRTEETFAFIPFPPFIEYILDAGGMIPYLKKMDKEP